MKIKPEYTPDYIKNRERRLRDAQPAFAILRHHRPHPPDMMDSAIGHAAMIGCTLGQLVELKHINADQMATCVALLDECTTIEEINQLIGWPT